MDELYICKRDPPVLGGHSEEPKRVPIHVFAMNEDRVLYDYQWEDQWRVGCVSRTFFDKDYQKVEANEDR